MRQIVSAVLFGTLLLAGSIGSVSAENATLKQQIVPLDCIFEEVNDGLGTLHYLTPEACGVIIPPTIEPTPAPGQTGSGGALQQTVQLKMRSSIRNGIYRSPVASQVNPAASAGNGLINVILLNNIAAALQDGGYLVQVHVGSTFFYRPYDRPQAAIRSVVVTKIDASGVTFNVQQLGLTFHLEVSQAQTFDHLNNGQSAIGIRLEKLTSPGSATIRIQLLPPITPGQKSASQNPQLWVIILMVVVLFGLRTKPHWAGRIR